MSTICLFWITYISENLSINHGTMMPWYTAAFYNKHSPNQEGKGVSQPWLWLNMILGKKYKFFKSGQPLIKLATISKYCIHVLGKESALTAIRTFRHFYSQAI